MVIVPLPWLVKLLRLVVVKEPAVFTPAARLKACAVGKVNKLVGRAVGDDGHGGCAGHAGEHGAGGAGGESSRPAEKAAADRGVLERERRRRRATARAPPKEVERPAGGRVRGIEQSAQGVDGDLTERRTEGIVHCDLERALLHDRAPRIGVRRGQGHSTGASQRERAGADVVTDSARRCKRLAGGDGDVGLAARCRCGHRAEEQWPGGRKAAGDAEGRAGVDGDGAHGGAEVGVGPDAKRAGIDFGAAGVSVRVGEDQRPRSRLVEPGTAVVGGERSLITPEIVFTSLPLLTSRVGACPFNTTGRRQVDPTIEKHQSTRGRAANIQLECVPCVAKAGVGVDAQSASNEADLAEKRVATSEINAAGNVLKWRFIAEIDVRTSAPASN